MILCGMWKLYEIQVCVHNKVLLQRSHTNSFTFCLRQLLYNYGKAEKLQQRLKGP